MDLKTLESKKISDLRVIAQSLGIDATSLKKNELITAISGHGDERTKVAEAAPVTEKTEVPEVQVRKRGRKPKNPDAQLPIPLETAATEVKETPNTKETEPVNEKQPIKEERANEHRQRQPQQQQQRFENRNQQRPEQQRPVSYTHLTLPTK
jgi:hypothetical protein